ncbi:Uncharacterized protein OS=Singulisphaera acidiphila (strain ATCC BAA-1392 / DSM 18658 / VKM B-2454 / MOB10) GN=Sinac_3185 PE=4 SV=1 [Gemmata massiliana]|uniref:Uncharacterized protein n=1 Tax=Gemmata massiliana TaxID=1210884 RepID=A0A6P2CT75_9BACT|nr:hypothetical protein [Gemmata massiliana]VTR92131.1 Uncharacterized protein OS=Singulisphaera acidiphila (strain ATCC BAA-1392 / DSM 18658 / VKM B-2454 / MOB10) GN=Sinac_3185 PE=4 SV=1 [Gemmata massiliana]
MSLTVLCPGCGVQLSFSDDQPAGQSQCPKCSFPFTVPSLAPPEPAAAEAPKLRFACPTCRKVYKSNGGDAGKKMVCKQCGAKVIIPEAPQQAAVPGIPLPSDGEVEPEEEPVPVSTFNWSNQEPPGAPRRQPPPKPPALDFDDEEPEDDHFYRPRRRQKPGKLTAIGGMLIGGGTWAIGANVLSFLIFPLWCFWPGFYFAIVWGILAIIRGASMLSAGWRGGEPRTLVVLQIVQIVNLDVVNLVLGIVNWAFLNDREVRSAFRRRWE